MGGECVKIAAVLIAATILAVSACDTESLQFGNTSMEPTIRNGDTIFVDYSVYRRQLPGRWDLVAYEARPPQGSGLWVMRVIGLPGEKIKIDDEGLLVDGKRLEIPRDLSYLSYVPREILDPRIPPEPFRVYSVPDESYFLLGDNSKRAGDSRFYGSVSIDQVKGRVKRICQYDLQCVWHDSVCNWVPEGLRPAECAHIGLYERD